MNTQRFFLFAAAACMGASLCFGAASAQVLLPKTKLADANPGEVRMFVAGSMRSSLLAVQDQIEKATGRKLVLQADESRTLQDVIDSGQPFEGALLTDVAIQHAKAQGRTAPGSVTPIASVLIGVAARGDFPKDMDVSTPEGIKKAMRGAHSIRRFYGVAISVPIVANLFDKLGMEEESKSKLVLVNNDNPVPEAPLAKGQYEIIINLISALVPMKGWTLIGPIPQQYQKPVLHSFAIGATGDAQMGRKVLAVLKGPEFAAALKANGINQP